MHTHVGFGTLSLNTEALHKVCMKSERVEREFRGDHAIPFVSCGGEMFLGLAFNNLKGLDLFLELKPHTDGLIFGYELRTFCPTN